MPQVAKSVEGWTYDSTVRHVRGSRSAIRKGMLLLTIAVCALLTSCKNGTTIWSTEVQSPDGRWIARALTKQYSGPGNAGLLTTVYMKRIKGPDEPIEILLFEQDATSINLKMNWLTASHLEVTYKQPAVIDFQAIKCGGVDISVRDVSSDSASSAQNATDQ
jgi:hypothetical protein